MTKTINDRLSELTPEEKAKFRKALMSVLHDKEWCNFHGVGWGDPDIQRAKEVLYSHMYEEGMTNCLGVVYT